MVGQSPDSGPRGQWPEQQQLRLRDAGPNGWDMELHQHCPVTASQCHHLGLTGQARERQRQQHSPVMVDQSCDLESQRPGPESFCQTQLHRLFLSCRVASEDWSGLVLGYCPLPQKCSCWFRTMYSGAPRWPIFLMNFPLTSPYSPKANHCGRVRRPLSGLVRINAQIKLGDQLG